MQYIKNRILFCLLLLLILLPASTAISSAATLTWTGLSTDNLASNPANWSGNSAPVYGDGVIFDNTSTKDCTWDFDQTLSLLSVTPSYTGTITQNAKLTVATVTFAAPAATTEPATNKNGTSAKLNATVNPNGHDTQVYFELGETQIYAYMTPSETIAAGNDNATFSQNIPGLLPNTVYHYRVVATNSEGTTYGDDVTFTIPPITITITSPAAGANITRPDILVKGTITTAISEFGVTVNGMPAMVYSNKFAANHVPLTEGSNTITVTATDLDGNVASTSITVNAATTGNYIHVIATPESGIAPLETMLKITGSFSIDNSGMRYTVPAELLPWDPVDEWQFRMSTQGIYYFTASSTGPDNIEYEDTIAVAVLNAATLDDFLKTKWDAMKAKLIIKDVIGGVNYISNSTRNVYQQALFSIIDDLPQIVADMQPIELIYSISDVTKYRINRLQNIDGVAGLHNVLYILHKRH